MHEPRRRGRDVTRLEALSDGVFAFSATLLVVSLEVPRTLAELLVDLHGIAAFAISFAALLLIWAAHNGFFRRYGLQDAPTIALNGALLFVVLFYVYPLKFVSKGFAATVFGLGQEGARTMLTGWEDLGTLFVLYGVGWIAIFLCFTLLHLHAVRRADVLGLDAGERHDALGWAGHYTAFVLAGLLSVALAASGVGIRIAMPGWIYAILGPLCHTWGWYWGGRRPGREEAPAPAPTVTPPAAAP